MLYRWKKNVDNCVFKQQSTLCVVMLPRFQGTVCETLHSLPLFTSPASILATPPSNVVWQPCRRMDLAVPQNVPGFLSHKALWIVLPCLEHSLLIPTHFIWLTSTYNPGCILKTWKYFLSPRSSLVLHLWVSTAPCHYLTGFKLPVYLPSSWSHYVAAMGLHHFDLPSRKNLLFNCKECN